ncbi:MAG TPA: beta-galactosidase GalB, partial [Chthoniobacterales bacterium]
SMPASENGRQIHLEIEGAMSYSAVWCNGHFVGGWPYGYSSYQVDLTPYIQFGGINVVAIRLDNPPDSSRWYPGGGIYRNVWLVSTAPVHVAHWGTQITTPEVSHAAATVKVETTVENDSAAATDAQISIQLFRLAARNGSTIREAVASSTSERIQIRPASRISVTQPIAVKNPAPWSVASPNLYVAVTNVTVAGKLVDATETTFGIRTIEFTIDRGFLLNGEGVPIKGVCLHHDLGSIGIAFNVAAARRQLEIMKEVGVNAIRTSHNPPAPELLDLCDEMGFLVMDESFDCWRVPKKPNGYNLIFNDWAERDLRAEVRRDRNHPSIILWSIGNEIPEQTRREGPAIEKMLSSYVHEEDTTRPTTIAVSDARGGYNGFQTGVDVFGYNYKPGEYGKFRKANPTIPIFGSETSSCTSSRGEYVFPVSKNKSDGKSDFQMSSYDLYSPAGWATLPDWEFKGLDQYPFAAGEFVWTGFDYLGEPTPYNDDLTNLLNYHTAEAKAKAAEELKALGKLRVPSRSSYFGMVDLAGFKKDLFYLYQSRWRPDLPMAHILPHWTWPGREGQITPVYVYTSGDEAELFLNGKSLGRKKKGPFEYRLCWDDVAYQPGELEVVAYKNGKLWAKDAEKTAGLAAKLAISANQGTMRADGTDLSFVSVQVLDRNGVPVPQADIPLHFVLSGPGTIVATDNGNPTDHTPFQSADRNAFNGRALAIIRALPGHASHTLALHVSSPGLSPADITLEAVH